MITGADLQGHWRRDWIKAPGFEDHTTRVHWMQAGALFADIRVPLNRPDLTGHSCLADLPATALERLLHSEGFAGTIDVTDNTCTWHRETNWHGPPEADDIGLMSFDGAALFEDGLHAKYRERWLRVPTPPLRGHRITLHDMSGVLIENDTVFLIAIGPAPETHAKPDPHIPDRSAIKAHFASTYCMGHWQETDQGIATLSTNPFCEGQTVLTRKDGFTWQAPAFDGSATPQHLSLA